METVDIRYLGSDGQYQAYSPQDVALINTGLINAKFSTTTDYIEYFIKDLDGSIIASSYNATQYTIGDVVDPITATVQQLYLDPVKDAEMQGIDRGTVNVKYNFLTNRLASSPTENFWIKEISTSRTEVKAARQDLSNEALAGTFGVFNAALSADAYYPTFYLNFGDDRQVIGVNAMYVEEDEIGYILFKLYEPLPDDFGVKSLFWVVTQVANSAEFNITINVAPTVIPDTSALRGPNFKVAVSDRVGETTKYYNYANLFSTIVTSSFQQLKSLMNEKGILINTDYSNLSNFIHFSSATERLHNYVYKLQQIESASYGLTQNNTVQARVLLETYINSTIQNFDGWEYYLQFTSESTAWPKINNTPPYQLHSVTSSEAVNWLGSVYTNPSEATMSMYWSASYYDDQNKDWLIYATPQYILDDATNAPYLTFLNMIGQHFDNIWLYYQDVSKRYQANNNPFVGISMDQVSEALRSFGIQLYTNTSITDSIYYSLLGINQTGSALPVTSSRYSTVVFESSSIYPSGSTIVAGKVVPPAGNRYLSASLYLPPIADELITRYVLTFAEPLAVGAGYWDASGSVYDAETVYDGFGTTVTDPFPTLPGTQIQDEIYKRLYHNLPYLLKTRGTERGIKALIATYGVPANIMQVHEYGGYDYRRVSGIQEISNTRILTGSVLEISSSLLNPFATLQYYSNDLQKTSINVQAGFSPADSINASITSSGYVTSSTQPGYFNIMQLIGAPNLQYSSSYLPLDQLSNKYFTAEYTSRYNVWDFIRLIKYFNNSLFKMIRDWVPARASAETGIIIKSHMLERNKYPRKEPTYTTSSHDADYLLADASGSSGGSVEANTYYVEAIPIQYNGTASMALSGAVGTVYVSSSNDIQKYTGEFSGSYIQATTNYFSQEEISSYIYPWTSSTAGNNGLFLTYSLSPLYHNVTIPVRSQRYLDLDYNSTQLAPVNYSLITQSIARTVALGNVYQSAQPYSQYAFIQDYNYNARGYTLPRYSGSYLRGEQYNKYTAGDISYGKDPVIDRYSNRLGLFTQIATSSFLPGKVNASLAYLADVSGGLYELNQNNDNWIDVQNIFVAGTQATIKQFDNKKFSNQVATDGIKAIYNSGYNYSPQLYFVSGVDSRLYFQYLGVDNSTSFRGYVVGTPNSGISGITSPTYPVVLDPGTTVNRGSIFNYLDGETPATNDFTVGTVSTWPKYTTPLSGQRTFTINLTMNVEFPNPQTFGNQSVQYTWTAVKNGTTILGTAQNINFASQYSAGGATDGYIIGFVPTGPVDVTDGPFNSFSATGPFTIIIDGDEKSTGVDGTIVYGTYQYTVGGGPLQSGLLPISTTGGVTTYIGLIPGGAPTLLQEVTEPGAGTGPVNTAAGQVTLNYTTPVTNLIVGDMVEFRLSQSFCTTTNITASFVAGESNSYLTSQVATVGQGAYPYATVSSSGYINSIADVTPTTSTLIFNKDVTAFADYQFVPFFTSGGVEYSSSLYPFYGDVNYPLAPAFGDKIVMSDFSGITQEVDVVSSQILNNTLTVTVSPQVLDNWMINPKLIYKFLLLKKYEDEQNVILTFNKNPGATSYGFLIPDTINPIVVRNINTLQAAVQSQVLTSQAQGTGPV